MRIHFPIGSRFSAAAFFDWVEEHLFMCVDISSSGTVVKKKKTFNEVVFKLRPCKTHALMSKAEKAETMHRSRAIGERSLVSPFEGGQIWRESAFYGRQQKNGELDREEVDELRAIYIARQQQLFHSTGGQLIERERRTGSCCPSSFMLFMDALFLFVDEDVHLSTALGMLAATDYRKNERVHLYTPEELFENDLQKIIRKPIGKKEYTFLRDFLVRWMNFGRLAFDIVLPRIPPKYRCACMKSGASPCSYKSSMLLEESGRDPLRPWDNDQPPLISKDQEEAWKWLRRSLREKLYGETDEQMKEALEREKRFLDEILFSGE